ncbi:hypothetical protein [Flammeovirga kamogawensis]|uniref:Glycosyltransferase RgtA/B/C/D-like domain-containing protein n=1 Tax=Flammeovirga kamogawensis TaxID=373891 RepID=A0ABX8GZK2_9BACT|nr:hypothetical protein [Flammeovirga kamogawensis]MBB6459488.1 hypothetical protein [Flammeovirga kamogawensis]QWG09040.1 hypothetical protein KM029_08875 [Flammeovirga kamogawensis]TRX67328.1 hypothetical protein EO216_03915 [Flammeovirga kamogawensis]
MGVFSLCLLTLLVYLHYQNVNNRTTHFSKIYFTALLIKFTLGVGVGLLYTFYYSGGDTFSLFNDGIILSKIAKTDFSAYLNFITSKAYRYPEVIMQQLTKSNASSTYFGIILSFLALLTGENYWISSLYISFFAFTGIWKLISELYLIYPKSKYSLFLTFFLIPSFSFWSSGILKESLAIGCICWVIGYGFDIIRKGKINFSSVIIPLFCLLILLKIKFYYFAGVITFLPLFYIAYIFNKNNYPYKSRYIFILMFLIVSLINILPQIHYHLDFNRLPNTIYLNYQKLYQASDISNAIHFPNLKPTWTSIIQSTPKALFTSFTYPSFASINNIFTAIVCFENYLLILCGLISLTIFLKSKVYSKKPYLLWMLILVLLYCSIMIALITLSSPNLGSLNRYKIGASVFLFYLSFMQIEIFLRDKSLLK